MAVLEELADALVPGEGCADPDDDRDPDAGQVLGPFQAVGITLGGGPAGQPEAEEHHGAGRYVRQVVDRVAEEPHRSGQDRQQQLDEAGSRQSDGADGDGPVGLAPVLGVVAHARQRKRRRRVAEARRLMHPARIPTSRGSGKSGLTAFSSTGGRAAPESRYLSMMRSPPMSATISSRPPSART